MLAELPEGGERVLVADILLSASSDSNELCCQGTEEELAELLCWMEREGLVQKSKKLIERIAECTVGNDDTDLQQLVFEKMEVDKALQSLRQKSS